MKHKLLAVALLAVVSTSSNAAGMSEFWRSYGSAVEIGRGGTGIGYGTYGTYGGSQYELQLLRDELKQLRQEEQQRFNESQQRGRWPR